MPCKHHLCTHTHTYIYIHIHEVKEVFLDACIRDFECSIRPVNVTIPDYICIFMYSHPRTHRQVAMTFSVYEDCARAIDSMLSDEPLVPKYVA